MKFATDPERSKCQPTALYSDCGGYKICTYDNPLAPACVRMGARKVYAAYIPVNARGQFGNHVSRAEEFYLTLTAAKEACKKHKRV